MEISVYYSIDGAYHIWLISDSLNKVNISKKN